MSFNSYVPARSRTEVSFSSYCTSRSRDEVSFSSYCSSRTRREVSFSSYCLPGPPGGVIASLVGDLQDQQEVSSPRYVGTAHCCMCHRLVMSVSPAPHGVHLAKVLSFPQSDG